MASNSYFKPLFLSCEKREWDGTNKQWKNLVPKNSSNFLQLEMTSKSKFEEFIFSCSTLTAKDGLLIGCFPVDEIEKETYFNIDCWEDGKQNKEKIAEILTSVSANNGLFILSSNDAYGDEIEAIKHLAELLDGFLWKFPSVKIPKEGKLSNEFVSYIEEQKKNKKPNNKGFNTTEACSLVPSESWFETMLEGMGKEIFCPKGSLKNLPEFSPEIDLPKYETKKRSQKSGYSAKSETEKAKERISFMSDSFDAISILANKYGIPNYCMASICLGIPFTTTASIPKNNNLELTPMFPLTKEEVEAEAKAQETNLDLDLSLLEKWFANNPKFFEGQDNVSSDGRNVIAFLKKEKDLEDEAIDYAVALNKVAGAVVAKQSLASTKNATKVLGKMLELGYEPKKLLSYTIDELESLFEDLLV